MKHQSELETEMILADFEIDASETVNSMYVQLLRVMRQLEGEENVE